MKKVIALLISMLLISMVAGCDDDTDKTNSQSEPQSESKSENIVEEPIETAEDLIGVWKVTQPLPDYFTKEYCDELGLKDFKTSAVYEWHIELNEDGTTTYVIDYELNEQSRKKSHYTCFYELFSEAKRMLPEDEFESLVKASYGYENYQKLLDENKINEYTDSEHYEGYKEFLRKANAEMKKHVDSAIEEQAAIGFMWGELLKDVGTRFVYKDGVWQPLASVRYNWSFENGTFRYDAMKHQLSGTTDNFTMDGDFFKNSTWVRVK